jgi:hypothetical protein
MGGREDSPARRRRPVRREKPAAARSAAAPKPLEGSEEVLIVASRLKDYIRRVRIQHSDRVLAPLPIVRRLCDEAQSATREGCTTVLERDIPG